MNHKFREKLIEKSFLIVGSTAIIIVAGIFFFLFKEAWPFLKDPGFSALLKTRWVPVSFQGDSFGLLPLITGSLLVTAVAILIVVPLDVCSAVYISEIATGKEKEFLKPFIEILAGIPSVVIGFFGLVVLVPAVKAAFGLNTGLCAFSGSVLLALMALPTVISISEDALASVPSAYKQASLALGASRMATIWKVTVPAALPGMITAIMLGTGRVIGETMAVMMVTGNSPVITADPFESVRTMTATIAAEMGEVAFGSDHYRALFCVGLVLLLLTFILNIAAQRILKKYKMG